MVLHVNPLVPHVYCRSEEVAKVCISPGSSEDLNTISELSHCFYSSHESPASICATEVYTIMKPSEEGNLFLLLVH